MHTNSAFRYRFHYRPALAPFDLYARTWNVERAPHIQVFEGPTAHVFSDTSGRQEAGQMRSLRFRLPFLIAWGGAALAVLVTALAWAVGWPANQGGAVAVSAPAAHVWIPLEPKSEIAWIADHETGPYITAHAAIVIDNVTGTVLYSKNPHQTRAPASTTKILTALLALEKGGLDEIVSVSRYAAGTTGSTARLYTGQKIRMIDLLHGLLLSSGNDAAVAVAEHIAGSEDAFVRLMNARAAELGALNTRFQNPHGLDKPGHFSTAYDLALLARLALLYPTFAEIVAKQTYSSESGAWTNTNKLLWSYEGIEGIKTGTTGQAGYCLVATATQNGMQLITVVLGSTDRWSDTRKLLDYGFDNFHLVTLADKGDVIARLPIDRGMDPIVAVTNRPLTVVVRDEDVAHISTEWQIHPNLKAPIARGQTVGTIQVYIGETLAKEVPLVSAADIERRTIFRTIWRWATGA